MNFLDKLGLTRVVPKEEPTHNKGGHLDQVWTNLEVVKTELVKVGGAVSDHKAICTKLSVKISPKQKRVYD